MVTVNTSSIDVAARAAEQAQPQISAVSRARAANGNGRLSAESIEAIKQGALPPIVNAPKEDPPSSAKKIANTQGVEETPVSEGQVNASAEALASATKEIGNIVDIQA